jgi:hypothetical protein
VNSIRSRLDRLQALPGEHGHAAVIFRDEHGDAIVGFRGDRRRRRRPRVPRAHQRRRGHARLVLAAEHVAAARQVVIDPLLSNPRVTSGTLPLSRARASDVATRRTTS